jgi:hypothetical protein
MRLVGGGIAVVVALLLIPAYRASRNSRAAALQATAYPAGIKKAPLSRGFSIMSGAGYLSPSSLTLASSSDPVSIDLGVGWDGRGLPKVITSRMYSINSSCQALPFKSTPEDSAHFQWRGGAQ